MAGTKSTLTSDDFYGAFEAQEMGKKHAAELEITVVDYPNMVYVGEEHGNARGYISDKAAKEKGLKIAKLSGTEFRKRLRSQIDMKRRRRFWRLARPRFKVRP